MQRAGTEVSSVILEVLRTRVFRNLRAMLCTSLRKQPKPYKGCLKVAQGIRSDATRTLVMLNEQGEKITRTHQKTVDIDHDLREMRL